jgi:outer membrane receptor protein involved in Fe transport
MKTTYLLLLTILPFLVKGQSDLNGLVAGPDGQPLDGVTVTLSQQNKNLAAGFSDLGHFSIKAVPPGAYTLFATSMGYLPVTREINLPVDTIRLVMQRDNKQLQGITVAAARPIIERKIDRVTFNVENSIVASGASAWEALTKTPGVQTGADNAIKANRKAVSVYLDGKPLYISGDDLMNYLQGLPSDQVARIEVYSNPPARFEAEGQAVINIITKKVKKQGLNVVLNGSFTQGVYGSYAGNTNFNYRKDKLNVYGTYGFTHKETFMDHNLEIDYGTSYWQSPNHNRYKSDRHSYRLGADCQLADNQVLGVLVTGNNRTGFKNSYTPTRITSKNKTMLDSTMETNGRSSSGGSGYSFNVNYNLKLDSGKSGFNVDLDYSPYQSKVKTFLNNQAFLPDGSFASAPSRLYMPSMQDISILSGKVDFNKRINKGWELTTGIKYSDIQSSNTFDFYDNSGKTPVLVPENVNHFNYREKIGAAYGSLSGSVGRLTIQGGLRAELTYTRGYSPTLDSLNERSYFKLFPTLYLQYKLNEEQELLLTYAKRLNRPEYILLNPARHYTSPYNYYSGNPALQPAYVHNIELGYTFKKDYNVTAYYTLTSTGQRGTDLLRYAPEPW